MTFSAFTKSALAAIINLVERETRCIISEDFSSRNI